MAPAVIMLLTIARLYPLRGMIVDSGCDMCLFPAPCVGGEESGLEPGEAGELTGLTGAAEGCWLDVEGAEGPAEKPCVGCSETAECASCSSTRSTSSTCRPSRVTF